ncbi:MAG: hypothetical protein ACRDO8_11870, partial [Nocardioidaceae bacterium]
MSAASPAGRLLLPERARLVHIGPHKTGTTALQSAFHHNRVAIAAQGVHYAGRGQQPAGAAIAVNRGRPMRGELQLGIEAWERLVREIRAVGPQRVFLSSEFLANADDATARRVVSDIDHPETHILITLRPLWKITPSQWQQYVQNGNRTGFSTWLDRMLNQPPYDRPSPSFWRRHRHGALVERWAEAVGPDHVTVVVVDDSDRSMLMRTVEDLLGLSAGTLVPHVDRTNRSLTWPEAELVRRLNKRYFREGWPEETYATLIRRGAVQEMKRHPPDAAAAPVTLPPWSHAPLEQAARDAVSALQGSAVRAVGDLSDLARPVPGAQGRDGAGSAGGKRIDPSTAAHALLGVIEASGEIAGTRA